jgi:hypothetical protein
MSRAYSMPIDERLSVRIVRSIAEIHGAHGHERFRANDGKPLSWAVSIKSPLKDPLINGFKDIDNVSAYDQWVAVLEQIELARTVAGVEPADRSYPAILDSNVAVITGCAGPVDDHTVLDDRVDLGIRYSSVTRLQHYPDPSAKVRQLCFC